MASLPTLLVGTLAALEAGLVCILTFPLPVKIRKALLKNLLESVVFAKIIFGLKISAVFVLILFGDAANTFVRLTIAHRRFSQAEGLDGGDIGIPVSAERSARIILSERNMALSGSTLFLTYLIWRLFELNIYNIRLEEKIAKAEGRDLGKPIEASRQEFQALQEDQKPNFEQQAADHQAIKKRHVAIISSDAPAPEVSNERAEL